ncbi:MAG: hypothetical protein WA828_01635 [Coleofasciculaceae cyanobacterium]
MPNFYHISTRFAELIIRQAVLSGRVVETYLTAQGEELWGCDRVAEKIEAQVLADFSVKEQARFPEYLLCCVANLEAQIPGFSRNCQKP